MSKSFAIIGVAGYIAPRHLKAIKETGGEVVAAYDPFDAVGVLDSYFPNTAFFTEFERFDRHLEKLKRAGHKVDYVVVCSPNYLHDAHCRFGLRYGANVICEKPLVLRPTNAMALKDIENEYNKKIFNILQLRLHPEIQQLKQDIEQVDATPIEIELTYLTPRGSWYYSSWKGDESKSGGVATNIGIHFFDMLIWIFGEVEKIEVFQRTFDRVSGFLKLKRANVKWYLSIAQLEDGQPQRFLKIGDKKIDFSKGFDNLHTLSYQKIMENQGFLIQEVLPSIQLVHTIRTIDISPDNSNTHPFSYLPLAKHPFE